MRGLYVSPRGALRTLCYCVLDMGTLRQDLSAHGLNSLASYANENEVQYFVLQFKKSQLSHPRAQLFNEHMLASFALHDTRFPFVFTCASLQLCRSSTKACKRINCNVQHQAIHVHRIFVRSNMHELEGHSSTKIPCPRARRRSVTIV